MASRVNPQKLIPSNTERTQDAILAVEKQNNAQQTQVYTFLGQQLTNINRNIVAIASNLNTLTAAIQGETVKEQARANEERRSRIAAAERTAFGRSESIVEGKLTSALMKPVRAIKGRITTGLGSLTKALTFLFVGWLTNKFIRLFSTDAEQNREEFDRLKSEITIALAGAAAAFALLNPGFAGLTLTIGALAAKVAAWVATKPFTSLFNRLREPTVRPRPNPTQPGRTQPGTTQPGRTQPGRTQPSTTQPGRTQPGTTQPGRTQPGTTQPGTTQPPKVQPKPGLKDAFKKFFSGPRFINALGTALKVKYVYDSVKGRLDEGQTPSRAVLTAIPEMLITLKGASLGSGLSLLAGGPFGALLLGAAGATAGGAAGYALASSYITPQVEGLYDSLNGDTLFQPMNEGITKAMEEAAKKFAGPQTNNNTTTKVSPQTPAVGSGPISLEVIPFNENKENEAGSPEELRRGESVIDSAPVNPFGNEIKIGPTPSAQTRANQLTQASKEGERAMVDDFNADMNRIREEFRKETVPSNSEDNTVPDVLSYDPKNPYRGIAEKNYNVIIPGR